MVLAANLEVTPRARELLGRIRSAVVLSVIQERPVQASRSTPELSARSTASTSSLAHEPSYTSSWTTDDTLSMITTPWTTESYTTDDGKEDFWTMCDLSSATATPQTTSSYGISTVFDSYSKTLTIYSFQEFDSESRSIRPLGSETPSGLSSTFSSWTVEPFTSSGWLSDVSSDLVKVRYPWSPFTEVSYTDTYPSSLGSITRSFPSSVTLKQDSHFPSLELANEETILVL